MTKHKRDIKGKRGSYKEAKSIQQKKLDKPAECEHGYPMFQSCDKCGRDMVPADKEWLR